MDGYMDGWWLSGWISGVLMDGLINGLVDGLMGGWIEVDEGMSRYIGVWIVVKFLLWLIGSKWMDGRVDRWVDRWMGEWVGWMDELIVYECMSGWIRI